MTPCEKLGYKVGDRFEVIVDDASFYFKSIIELGEDDGSEAPYFKLLSGICRYDDGAYVSLKKIRKIENTMDIIIPCPEGYEFDGIRKLMPSDAYLNEQDYKTVGTWDERYESGLPFIALKKKQPDTLKFEFERVEGNEIDNGMYWTDYANRVPLEWRGGKKILNQLDLFRSAAIWRLKDDDQS